MRPLLESLLIAPAGAVFLARLEAQQRDMPWWEIPGDVDLGAIGDVIGGLQARSFGELLAIAVGAAESDAGPWSSQAPLRLAAALRTAPQRRALAAALVERLEKELTAPMDPTQQEWWWSPWPWEVTRSFAPLGEGEHSRMRSWCTASWQGVWTVTAPAEELADELVNVWEHDGATSRWRLVIDESARVFEVSRPAEWEWLVRKYPAEGTVEGHWELPGGNQGDVTALAELEGQRAMRTEMRRFLVPDWNAVARDWDGVHLTWGGFLTTEGLVIDMGSGDVAMLRGWGSERTLWLNAVLSDPVPLERPPLSGRINANMGVDVTVDFARQAEDFEWLKQRLGARSGRDSRAGGAPYEF